MLKPPQVTKNCIIYSVDSAKFVSCVRIWRLPDITNVVLALFSVIHQAAFSSPLTITAGTVV